MKNFDLKKIIPHIIAVFVFTALTLGFFAPEMQGKKLEQSDITKHAGISKEIRDYRENTGEQVLWTNSLFGGMPAYLVSVKYSNPIILTIDKVFRLGLTGGKRYMLLYMIGFYILLMTLKVDPWLSILGAIAFAMSSYHILILPAGHNAKANVIAYLPVILAGFYMLFQRKKYIAGTALSALAIALALRPNHPQMLYYLFMILMVVGVFFLIDSIKEKTLPHFFKASGLFILATVLGIGTSATQLLTVNEYSKSSTRGGTELSDKTNNDNKTGGLDRDYITSWSYGVMESFTLLVPDFYGGQSKIIGDDKEAMKEASRENRESISRSVGAYWGNQPYVAGSVYAGAGIFLLTLLGFLMLKGNQKWALLAALLLMLTLSWGKNLPALTNLFIDYFPFYDKFRSVNSMMIGVLLIMPLVAILGLNNFVKTKDESTTLKRFYIASGVVTGVLLLMLIAPSIFTSFFADGEYDRLYGQLEGMKLPGSRIDNFTDDIIAVRQSIFTSDVMRSLFVVIAVIGALFLFLKNIIKKEILVVALLLITVADLWSVDRRYLNKKNFVSEKKQSSPFRITPQEKEILADKELGFRVFNLSGRLDSDARTSYFFKSLGGYHGAKMGRYQDIISNHLSQPINPGVINMLNTKYVIQGQGNSTQVQQNPDALGASWFIKNIKVVENADSEITALTDLDTKNTAIVDKRFESKINGLEYNPSSVADISMTDYHPDHLTYTSSSDNDEFAVFSEIYYQPGWQAYIDGKEAEHVRVNYILRGMNVPAGEHQIEFKFEPKTYSLGKTISMASSIILALILVGALYYSFKSNEKELLPLDG